MKALKMVIAILLTAALLFSMTSCQKVDSNDNTSSGDIPSAETLKSQNIQLLYCSNDTLNPFNTVNKINLEIGRLLYDSLVVCSNEFEPINLLAESVSYEDKVCTVTLKNAKFSDGTTVTVDDVLNSYSLAKNSSLYSYLFYSIKKVSAKDSKTIVFELSKNDPYFANHLTFPIIKKGTENLKNEDNVEILPTGSGRYIFSEDGPSLIANTNHYKGNTSIDKIQLVDAPDTESVEHYVEIGATDLYYTDPVNGNIIRMSGQKSSLNMNNLVFIGINHNYSPLANPKLRYIISSAIDRLEICNSAFYSNAVAANGFFHPSWSETDGYQTLQITAQTKIAIENLEDIGYNNLDTDGLRKNSKGKPLTLSLLVNKSNSSRLNTANKLKEQLEAIGISLTINAVSDEKYFEALKSGSFQLYLGEVKITANMDLGNVVLPGGSAAYGIKDYSKAVSESSQTSSSSDTEDNAETINYTTVFKNYYAGETEISNIATALITDMPIIPVAFRSALLFYSSNIKDVGEASVNDIFLSLDKF